MARLLCIAAVVVASFVASVNADCNAVLQSVASLPVCAQLQATQTSAGPQAVGMDCAGVKALNKQFYPNGSPPECCPALRDLVASGCACDNDFVSFVGTIGGLDAETSVKAIQGTVAMIQSGTCSEAAQGGPVANPCAASSLGPCPASA